MNKTILHMNTRFRAIRAEIREQSDGRYEAIVFPSDALHIRNDPPCPGEKTFSAVGDAVFWVRDEWRKRLNHALTVLRGVQTGKTIWEYNPERHERYRLVIFNSVDAAVIYDPRYGYMGRVSLYEPGNDLLTEYAVYSTPEYALLRTTEILMARIEIVKREMELYP